MGTFFIDTKKDIAAGVKDDGFASKLPSPVGESVSSLGFQPAGGDSSGGNPIRGNDDHQVIGGSHFMMQQQGVHVMASRHTEWGGHPDSRNTSYEMTGISSTASNMPHLLESEKLKYGC